MTLISVTMQPSRTFDVDAAELESLTRQGLLVTGGPRPSRPGGPPDPVVAYVSTTLNPDAVIGVDDAELESLTRQKLIAHTWAIQITGYGVGGYGTQPYGV